ncbi:MAG: glucosylceramidase [Clostridiales bacterium]|nr:glucosylceramidase [Clostridiales bacterium]
MKQIITRDAKKQYWEESEVARGAVKDCNHVVNIYPEFTGQTIQGFGGAFTEASTYNYSKLSPETQKEVIEGYFGENGLKYNMARTHIHSCDFALGNYTYVEEGDRTLETFSISHDKENMIPMIQEAMQTKGKADEDAIWFLASPWSPPAYMKTNGEMNHGGKLKEEYFELWAQYYVKYIKAYREEGINIRYITVQNEPDATQTWDSCRYTAEEEGNFVSRYLGPALEKAGLGDVKILVWDHNKEMAFDRADQTLSVEGAEKYIYGVGVHWYTGDHFESLELIHRKYPDKHIFFTEGCVEYSRFADSGEVQKAEMYAHDILGDLKSGIEAYFDWNLLLDELGGPNHVGNFCAAPMMCNWKEDTLEKRLSYYYIGHFSRYIKRGAKQIATTRYTDQIEAVAFLNPDGSRVAVLLNKTDQEIPVTLLEKGEGIETNIAAHSIVTYVY